MAVAAEIGQEQARDVGGAEQKEIPEGAVEPAEVLRMALVLEIVKDGDLRAGGQQGRGEAGVEEHVEAQAGRGQRQSGLFPDNPRTGARGRARAAVARRNWGAPAPGPSRSRDS